MSNPEHDQIIRPPTISKHNDAFVTRNPTWAAR
jgi:hypothetical protein